MRAIEYSVIGSLTLLNEIPTNYLLTISVTHSQVLTQSQSHSQCESVSTADSLPLLKQLNWTALQHTSQMMD